MQNRTANNKKLSLRQGTDSKTGLESSLNALTSCSQGRRAGGKLFDIVEVAAQLSRRLQ